MSFILLFLLLLLQNVVAIEWSDSAITTGLISEPQKSNSTYFDATSTVHLITIDSSAVLSSYSCAEVIQKSVPGVRVSTNGGIGSLARLSIRGSGSGKTAIYLDDIPLTDGNGRLFNLNALSGASIGAIEVYSGSSPSNIGSNSSGGTIRLLSDASAKTAGYRVTLGSGSFGYKLLALNVNLLSQGKTLNVSGEYLKAENDFPFTNTHRSKELPQNITTDIRNNDFFETYGLQAHGSAIMSNFSKIDGTLFIHREIKGIPGFENESDVSSFTDSWDNAIKINYNSDPIERIVYGSSLTSKYSRYRTKYDGRVMGNSEGDYDAVEYEQYYDFAPFAKLKINSENNLSVKQQFSYESIEPEALNANTRVLTHKTARRTTYSNILLSRIAEIYEANLSAGIEGNFQDATAMAADFAQPIEIPQTSRWDITGGFSLAWKIHSNLRLFSSINKTANKPFLFQLFGNRGYTKPNASLKSETGLNREIGLRWQHKDGLLQHFATCSAFWNSNKDKIIPFTHYATTHWINTDSARVFGLEFNSAFNYKYINVDLNLTAQDPRNLSHIYSDAYYWKLLPGESKLSGNVFMKISPIDKVTIGFGTTYKSKHYTSRVNDPASEISEAWKYDIQLSGKLTRSLTLSANIDNLTDQRAFDTYGLPRPGRSFALKCVFGQTAKKTNTKESL